MMLGECIAARDIQVGHRIRLPNGEVIKVTAVERTSMITSIWGAMYAPRVRLFNTDIVHKQP